MSEAEAAALREPWVGLAEQRNAACFGMWVFIASEILFFGAFFLGFAYLRILHPRAFAEASRHTELVFGAINTALLLASSCTLSLAASAAEFSMRRLAASFLWTTAGLGCAFLVVKGFEYHADLVESLWPGPGFSIAAPAAQLFFAAYWIITIIHVIHLVIGIGVVFRLAAELGHGSLSLASPQLEVAVLYWSFVDIVWVMLFPIIYLGGGI